MMAYTYYYRARLSREEQPIYNGLLLAMRRMEREIRLPPLTESAIARLISAIAYDNPELFYVDFQRMMYTFAPQGTIVHAVYAWSAAQARALMTRINAVARDILAQAEQLSPVEKELFLHDYLINHGEYGETPGRVRDAHTLVGALLDGKCVCEGFAKAFKFLCDKAEIPAMMAVGQLTDDANDEWHAWNIVRMDGRAYHVDVTHDLVKEHHYASRAHFNLSDAEMMHNRTPQPDFPLPACPQSGAVIPLVSSKAQLLACLREEALKGNARTEVRLSRGFTMEEIQRIVFEGPAVYDLWSNWIAGLRYGEGNRSVVIHWKNPSALLRAAARASRTMDRLFNGGHAAYVQAA